MKARAVKRPSGVLRRALERRAVKLARRRIMAVIVVFVLLGERDDDDDEVGIAWMVDSGDLEWPFSGSEGVDNGVEDSDQAREKGWVVHRPTKGIEMYTCWPGRNFQGRAMEIVTLMESPGRLSTRINVPPAPRLR